VKKYFFLLLTLDIFSFSVFPQESDYDRKETFVRKGFGFTYLDNEITSLAEFYKNHGKPIETDERISVNRMDGIIDTIILLEYETFHAKFIRYGERINYNGPKEELMNISSKDGVIYLYGIRNGMETNEVVNILGREEMNLGNSLWFSNEQGNIVVIYIKGNKIENIIWVYKMPE
jgi:hypothetical protein